MQYSCDTCVVHMSYQGIRFRVSEKLDKSNTALRRLPVASRLLRSAAAAAAALALTLAHSRSLRSPLHRPTLPPSSLPLSPSPSPIPALRSTHLISSHPPPLLTPLIAVTDHHPFLSTFATTARTARTGARASVAWWFWWRSIHPEEGFFYFFLKTWVYELDEFRRGALWGLQGRNRELDGERSFFHSPGLSGLLQRGGFWVHRIEFSEIAVSPKL
jgi:hypothetical protein